MPRSVQPSSCSSKGPLMRGNRGAIAILLVFGLSAVLLLLSAILVQQAGAALRMSSAEEDSFRVRNVLASTLNELAVKAESDPNFWQSEDSMGVGQCTPTLTSPTGSYPFVCRQVLPGRLVSMSDMNGDWFYPQVTEYPIRVVWKSSPSSSPQEMYAWLIIDPDTSHVIGLWEQRSWCLEDPAFYTNSSVLGFCTMGG